MQILSDPAVTALVFVPFIAALVGAFWIGMHLGRFACRHGVWRWASALIGMCTYLLVFLVLIVIVSALVAGMVASGPGVEGIGLGLHVGFTYMEWGPLMLLISLGAIITVGYKSTRPEKSLPAQS
ncbi:MAG: hypothetical protein NUV59_02395 [Patescibacteria group bacterium]|nr:hypothetical protein [Patescibacteria group bacterium]